MICLTGKAEYFSKWDWTGQIRLIRLNKFLFSRKSAKPREAQTSRVGADARYTFAPGKWLRGTTALAHRVDGGKNSDISGTIIGLFSITAPGFASARDWAELTGGIRLLVWTNGAITASVTL
jgi:hypothetical protein